MRLLRITTAKRKAGSYEHGIMAIILAIDIYNPWSVVKYIRAGNKPAPYWLSTSSNDFVHRIIERSSPETEDALKKVMDGGYLMTSLNTQVVYPTVYDNPDNIFSFLS